MESWFCLISPKNWKQRTLKASAHHSSWTYCVIAIRSALQLRVTAQFYLENSRKIHPRGMRACRPKDTKRREGAPALWLLCLCFFLAPGLSCVNWAARSAVWSSLRSSDLPLLYFRGIFPSCLFSSVRSLSHVQLFATP